MKRYQYLSALMLLLGGYLSATTVTGTIQDANGNRYASGTVSAFNIITGASMTPAATDVNGFFSITLSPSTYQFTVCARPVNIGPNGGTSVTQVCAQPATPIVISGGSQDVSAQINAVAPILGPSVAALLAANNTFTGLDTFTGGVIITGGAGALGTPQICTNCWGNTPSLSIIRQDNSPPVGGVDIGTAFLDALAMYRVWPSTVGSFVGSQTPLALVIANVNNKDYITLTQSVTASGLPQTVSVSDSSVISVVADINGFLNNQLNIDFGKGTSETVTVTAIPDSTHVTAIFSQNHANGANAHGIYNTGFHLGQMIVAGENAGNKTDILGQNINLTCNSAVKPGACSISEWDMNMSNGQRAATYSGEDATHSYSLGLYIALNAGVAGGVTDAALLYSLDGVTTAHNGLNCAGCAQNYGIVVTANAVATRVTTAFSVQAALLIGYECGSNQTAAENPNWTLIDPTDCFFLTSQGNGAFTQSNFLTFQSNAASVTHTLSLLTHWNAGGLFFLFDTHNIDTNNFTNVGTDGYFNTSNSGVARGYRLRSSNLIISSYENVNGAATLAPRNTGTLAITGNSFTFPEGSAATALASNDVCYGDSTAHWLECSMNNGSYGKVVLENAAETLTSKTITSPIINGVTSGSAAVLSLGYDSTTGTEQHNANNNGASSFSGAWNCINVTPVTVSTSTTADQNVMACTIPAGTLNRVGRTLRIATAGVYSTPAASTAQMTVKVKLCTVSGCGSGTVITLINIQSTALGTVQITNNNWGLNAVSTTQTAGATSSHEAHGDLLIDLATLTTAADSPFGDLNTATVGTIDSSAQLFLQVTFAFSAASASNTSTERQLIAETIN